MVLFFVYFDRQSMYVVCFMHTGFKMFFFFLFTGIRLSVARLVQRNASCYEFHFFFFLFGNSLRCNTLYELFIEDVEDPFQESISISKWKRCRMRLVSCWILNVVLFKVGQNLQKMSLR